MCVVSKFINFALYAEYQSSLCASPNSCSYENCFCCSVKASVDACAIQTTVIGFVAHMLIINFPHLCLLCVEYSFKLTCTAN